MLCLIGGSFYYYMETLIGGLLFSFYNWKLLFEKPKQQNGTKERKEPSTECTMLCPAWY